MFSQRRCQMSTELKRRRMQKPPLRGPVPRADAHTAPPGPGPSGAGSGGRAGARPGPRRCSQSVGRSVGRRGRRRLSRGGGARSRPARSSRRRQESRGAGETPGARGAPGRRAAPRAGCRPRRAWGRRRSAPPYLEPCSAERAARQGVRPPARHRDLARGGHARPGTGEEE